MMSESVSACELLRFSAKAMPTDDKRRSTVAQALHTRYGHANGAVSRRPVAVASADHDAHVLLGGLAERLRHARGKRWRP